jgi:hypothetical protein
MDPALGLSTLWAIPMRFVCKVYFLVWSAAAALAAATEVPGDWAFKPVRRVAVAEVKTGGWDRNPIDAFVYRRLAENGLRPAPQAERRTLIRRLTFDLHGLPPTPDEIDAFLRDDSDRAVAELVDRLLDSPRYGERWARHWLDVARFSESQGFERDKIRQNAWRYRDYVIDAFNHDLPYDRFMREQIAGDVLDPPTRAGIIATGFLVAGPYDEVGNGQKSQVMRARVREEDLEDIVSAVGQTFLGVTVNCSRCHDHKFDPIPQRDYYSIKAVFEGIRHGERSILTAADKLEIEARGTAPRLEIARAEDRLLAYAANPRPPEPTYLLNRGEVLEKGELMTARGLAAVTEPVADLGLKPDSPEAERRRRFADWLAHPANPLPARVMMNRVWQHHFGRGLVDTPSDFGASGGRPTHPELLDWLAGTFLREGWSLKAMHRLILTSATYLQSSEGRPSALAVDADNRWLWRYTPRRLEAEAVRDSMLAVAGTLNLATGGPGYRPFELVIDNTHFYLPRDKVGAEFNRRTIYRIGVQSLRDPVLDSLDCPDLSTKTPVRGRTTTPIQALALMNDSFVQRQAADFAARLRREAGGAAPDRIRQAIRLAFGRDAEPDEISAAGPLIEQHGLPQFCWALLNANEFIHVR